MKVNAASVALPFLYPRAGLIDTAPAARHAQIAYFRRLGPAGRVARADSSTAGVQRAAFAGFRRAHPELTPAATVSHWLQLTYGRPWPAPLGVHPGAPLAALLPMVETLETQGIPYAVTGSLAAACWGIPRSCADIDLIIATNPERGAALNALLSPEYAVDGIALTTARRAGGMIALLHRETLFKVDLRLMDSLPGTVRRVEWGPRPTGVAFLTPEALLWQTLYWYRQHGEQNEVAWLDAVGVLQMQRGQLDDAYLHLQAARHKLDELLAEAEHAAWELEFGPIMKHDFSRPVIPAE